MPRISASAKTSPVVWPLAYLAVGFTSSATLLLELTLTRIFSVVFYYHFAFLAISIALFGLGAGGVLSYLITASDRKLFSKLGVMAALNSLLVLSALVFLLTRQTEPGSVALALIYFSCALPFMFSGAILSLAIATTIERVDRVYFFDLIGAAGGCLLLVPLLNVAGGPNTVIAAAALFAASAAIWFSLSGQVRGRVVAVAVAFALVLLIVVNAKGRFVDIRYAKGHLFDNEIFAKWNSFSRVAIISQGASRSPYIIIDADAGTAIPWFNYDHLTVEDRRFLFDMGPGLPYLLRPGAKTLVIGPGGGWDVARALAAGSKDVTGVEINAIIASTIMRGRFAHFSNGLYTRPEVRIVVEDGRSYVRRSPEKYDVLQATLVDTWASTSAGAFALTENNLYTTDSFRDYLSHLTDKGIMAFTRWGFDPPRESLRLVSLAMDAFAKIGEKEAWRHMIVVRDSAQNLRGFGALDTVLISRRPFTSADLARVRSAMGEAKFELVYMPDQSIPNPFTELLRSPDPAAYEERYPFNISPVTDDKPFFFYSVQPRDLWKFLADPARRTAETNNNRAVPLLFSVLTVSLAATGIILVLPPLALGSRLPRERGVPPHLWYFVFIGAGYILIEISLIQRFVLFLGHPTYALTVIIFSMLVASGIGSFFSRRLMGVVESRLTLILAVLVGGLLALSALISPVIDHGVGWPLWIKVPASIVLIAPVGFLMGIPFPSGMRRLEARHRPSLRWAWSLNAASSVMGSAFAVFFAIYAGLQETLLIGSAFYAGALLLTLKTGAIPGILATPAPADAPAPVIQA